MTIASNFIKKPFGKRPAPMPEELVMAVGLVWGHLSTGQFALADQLARGCLQVWPEEKKLVLMAAYAAVELSMPLGETMLDILKNAECIEWSDRVLCRAGIENPRPEPSAAAPSDAAVQDA